jgi:hypothetical protein
LRHGIHVRDGSKETCLVQGLLHAY